MKNIKLFSGKIYVSEHDWKTDHFNAEDGKSFLGRGKAFLEVEFKDYSVRGDGLTIKEADNEAWNKHLKIENCKEHKFKRTSNYGRAVCEFCDKVIYNLGNIAPCKKENCKSVGYFYYDRDAFCSNHYFEKFEEVDKLKNKDDNTYYIKVFSYLIIKYIVENLKLKDDKEIYDKEIFFLNSYGYLMDSIECIYPEIELDDLFKISERIKTNKEKVKPLFDLFNQ